MKLHLHRKPAPAPSDCVVEFEDVHLAFDRPVLDGVTLRVKPQERLVVLGQSGSGKSTLLRLVIGILRPDRGTVRFNGMEITRMGRRQLNRVRPRIGMVYQYSALVSSLTVYQNLALPLEELTRKTRAEMDRIVAEKLEMVGMTGTEDKLPAELSGGMRKRVGLARALVLEPELILFDEPSAGLDPVISAVIDELIIDLTERTKTTSIIVTHEMDSAFKIATRMAMLYQGRVIADDAPERFKESTDPVVSQFISGNPEGPILDQLHDASS
jgi:phospholipid/cholesterol/gamma-HCH transport system ATP-binding protein